ncbi:hypothetical protein FDO65_12550 [Nakamurella flava]|uniref:NfeD-like C-terminal domain-containing protein n=1 Tax=Nakamurella flava TaxID=2576308 RepID=A0A4U6QEI1_9ACTN|nr:hypothetical protein [Nakamurella flava]TKV58396.1 hypothetical protein FDO65_12550 [Nakamurella flava]
MDPITLVFLGVGLLGVVLLLISLVVGDLLHLAFHDVDGPFSFPALAALVGGGGFIGAIPATLLGDLATTSRVLISAAVGLAGALPLAWGAVRLTAGLNRMPTDRTLTDQDVVGRLGRVISAIPVGGLGEVSVSVGGQALKYYARSAEPIPVGTPIFVTEALSATAVEVVSTAEVG